MNQSNPTNRTPLRRIARILKLGLPLGTVAAVLVAIGAVKGWSALALPWGHPKAPRSGHSELWCPEHDVPERLCTLCHPELVDELPWCREHNLPEELCTLCHPELAAQLHTCAHGLPPAYCAQCRQAAAPGGAGSDALPPVRLAGPSKAADAGIDVRPVQSAEHVLTVEGNAQVSYDDNRFAHVLPRVDGVLREVRVDLGTAVRRGDVLAIVDSAALGDAKGDYLAATAMIDLADKEAVRIRGLVAKGIAPSKDLLQAENRATEAQIQASRTRQTLLNLGLSDSDVQRLRRAQDNSSLLDITAPLDGVVVERHAVTGEPVLASSELFAVADLRTMWVHLDLYERDLPAVQMGQKAGFTTPSLASAVFPGTVTWISTQIDPRTRTVPVRIEVENPAGVLRANMFGKGSIEVAQPHRMLTVPKQAVQTYENQYVVFVKESDVLFEPRRVQLGHQFGRLWEVTSGVSAGEQVVTTGSFLLKTELNRGAIGAGCSD